MDTWGDGMPVPPTGGMMASLKKRIQELEAEIARLKRLQERPVWRHGGTIGMGPDGDSIEIYDDIKDIEAGCVGIIANESDESGRGETVLLQADYNMVADTVRILTNWMEWHDDVYLPWLEEGTDE